MPETTIARLFNIQHRYVRSVNLERDFADSSSLEGYVVTPQIKQMLTRLRSGLDQGSSQRAWRITGDYGSGKSSFALLLAHLFGGRTAELPAKFRAELQSTHSPKLLPVLVTGSRESLALTILNSLSKAISGLRTNGPPPRALEQIERLKSTAERHEIKSSAVINSIEAAVDYATRGGKYNGVLLVLDELGKSLEYSALHPNQQDVYLLQTLAESAARSGPRPLYVVGLLHQGFNAYADSLSPSAQREWEKVAGRFDEIIFSQPLDHVTHLIAEALSIKAAKLPQGVVAIAEADMERVLDLGWYGPAVNRKAMLALARRLYPLHPTVIPVLVRLFSRFGQNERSLFSFLLSNEPFSLHAFAERSLSSGDWYRLHNLFDYTRASFGNRLGLQSYRSHWNQIDSVIESFPVESVDELEILKTVGLLNLIDSLALPPTAEITRVACHASLKGPSHWKATLDGLQRRKRVVYFRGQTAGYCLWPHTSVNLEKAYEEACGATATITKVSEVLGGYLENRPIVARRHYIQTGNLRHFSVEYVPSTDIQAVLQKPEDQTADGRIVIVLCDTEADRLAIIQKLEALGSETGESTLVAVPRALNVLASFIQEVLRWRWILTNVPQLNHDRYAAEEVSRQLAAVELMLKKTVLEFVGLQQADRPTDLRWFGCGALLEIRHGKDLLSHLSVICDDRYPDAPRVKNELVNRRQLSSAAAAARMRLIERVFTDSASDRLGMDEGKMPPEMSMYLSVLVESGLHRQTKSGWKLETPRSGSDVCNIRPSLEYLLTTLRSSKGRRLRISSIIDGLRQAPRGVRDGLAYLLLAIFAQIYEQDLAFYENSSFMKKLDGEDFLRIVKDPASFEIQFYEMNAVRTDLYKKLSAVLQLPVSERGRVELLDIVRPLCQFVSNLPLYAQKTLNLDTNSLNVRSALLEAREPAILLFERLPHALSIRAGDAVSARMDDFISGLRDALEALRQCYPGLLVRIDHSVAQCFQVSSSIKDRALLATRANALLGFAVEPRLRALCVQLADQSLGDAEWLAALASLACSKPPSKWLDRDQELFERELVQLAAGFVRLESLLFAKYENGTGAKAFRVAITQQDGFELERVIYLDDGQVPTSKRIESKIIKLLEGTSASGEAALARAFWQTFSTKAGAQ